MKTMLTWTARQLLDQVEHMVMVDWYQHAPKDPRYPTPSLG